MKVPFFAASDDALAESGVAREMSSRASAEAALRASERRLRTIIDTEPECVKVVTRDGRLAEMNPAGLAMLQAASLEEAQRQPLLDFIVPQHRADFGKLHKRVMDGESGTLRFEITGLTGARRWLETHAAPLRDDAGGVQALLGITRDITNMVRAERWSNAELRMARPPSKCWNRCARASRCIRRVPTVPFCCSTMLRRTCATWPRPTCHSATLAQSMALLSARTQAHAEPQPIWANRSSYPTSRPTRCGANTAIWPCARDSEPAGPRQS